MKRKITLTLIIFLIGIISLIILAKEKEKIKTIKKENTSSFISMMVEDESGKYVEKNENQFVKDGYIFNSEKSGCENGGILTWNKEKEKIEASLITSDKCYAYFDKYDFTKSCKWGYEDNLGCELIKNKDNTLIYHDGKCDYEGEANCSLEAEDNNYRYAGTSTEVNNYVCFGSNVEPCPEDNLYRIIGIFDGNIKLIKADIANSELLGSNGTYTGEVELDNFQSNWLESSLNTLNLNNNYLNSFKEKWRQKIQKYSYQINGAKFDIYSTTNAKIIYDYELGKNAVEEKNKFAIGLMYISDYMYAANSKYWHYNAYKESGEDYRMSVNDNWMYMGMDEWTITKNNYWTDNAFFISYKGYPMTHYSHKNGSTVRPVFYLEKNIQAISGDGTESKPYYLSVND